MASETMRRLDEIVGSFREGVIVRVSCGGMLCGECIQCTARAAKASLQREQRAAQDEIARLTRELEEARRERSAARAEVLTAQASLRRVERVLEEAREREREYRHVLISLTFDDRAGIASTEFGSHCLYCLRDSADRDPTIVHDDDCPVKAGRRVLAAYVHGGPRWLTRTARRGEGGGDGE